jgi:hypothetical protein
LCYFFLVAHGRNVLWTVEVLVLSKADFCIPKAALLLIDVLIGLPVEVLSKIMQNFEY